MQSFLYTARHSIPVKKQAQRVKKISRFQIEEPITWLFYLRLFSWKTQIPPILNKKNLSDSINLPKSMQKHRLRCTKTGHPKNSKVYAQKRQEIIKQAFVRKKLLANKFIAAILC